MFPITMTNEYNGYLETQYLFNEQIIIGNEQNETEYSSLSLNYITSEKNIDQFCNFDLNMNIDEAYTKIFKPTESKEKKEKIFDVVLREREGEIKSLFTNIENEESNSNINDENFLKRKRYPQKRRRRENQDNMRKKIKRGFMNIALITKINDNLKLNNNISYLEKFPQNLVCDVTKKTNKDLIDMTLEQIFEKKELYDEDDLSKYEHNLKVIKSKEVQQNSELKAILNKKYSELFEEYIKSKEFKVDEINRLKKNKMSDSYIERYIYLSKHFIKFFSE
jgi:hypothetical protein